MTRTGRLELVGKTAATVVDVARAATIKRREELLAKLNTTATELAARIDFFKHHSPTHSILDATRARLADVQAEIAMQKDMIEELKTMGTK